MGGEGETEIEVEVAIEVGGSKSAAILGFHVSARWTAVKVNSETYLTKSCSQS